MRAGLALVLGVGLFILAPLGLARLIRREVLDHVRAIHVPVNSRPDAEPAAVLVDCLFGTGPAHGRQCGPQQCGQSEPTLDPLRPSALISATIGRICFRNRSLLLPKTLVRTLSKFIKGSASTHFLRV